MIVINKKEDSKIKNSFVKIKEEMNDHLDSINQNTNEINSNLDYIKQLEKMILKLNERMDEMEMKILDMGGKKIKNAEDFKNITLNPKEVEIFLLLYEEKGELQDYKKIARQLGLTEEIVRKNISAIVNKGIPIVKKYFDNKVYLVLDPDFRNLQAKNNILEI